MPFAGQRSSRWQRSRGQRLRSLDHIFSQAFSRLAFMGLEEPNQVPDNLSSGLEFSTVSATFLFLFMATLSFVRPLSSQELLDLKDKRQGEWPMQEQMPWQPPQMMPRAWRCIDPETLRQAPFPGGCGMASPMGCAGCGCPPRSGNMVTCPAAS